MGTDVAKRGMLDAGERCEPRVGADRRTHGVWRRSSYFEAGRWSSAVSNRVGAPARIALHESLETPGEKSRAGEQDQCQRDLHDNECVAHAMVRTARRGAARALLERRR